jgi:Tol biopolymer transport system component
MLFVVWDVYKSHAQVSNEAIFLKNTRQLIFEGKRSGEGYFSSDGKLLIFQAEREAENPFYQIYVLDLETGETNRVSPGFGKTTCAFFRPNSNQILYASTHHDPRSRELMQAEIEFRNSGQKRRYAWDYDPQMDIYVANWDGSNARNLTQSAGYDAEGAFSPDGQLIVFASNRSAFPLENLSEADRKKFEIDPAYFCEVYLMNADGSNVRRLTNWPGYDGGTFFSPDGQRIIFRHFNEEGTIADVYSMKLDGSDLRRLTNFDCLSWAPYYHPSQEYVAFAANKEGFSNFEIYLVDSEGNNEPVRITFTEGFDGLPVFSPDGTKLCWTSTRSSDKSAQLFIADWNHEAALEALRKASPRKQSTLQLKVPRTSHSAVKSAITAEDLKHFVSVLASDSLEGRMTGTQGATRAAELIGEVFGASSLDSFRPEYRHTFSFSREVRLVEGQNSFQAFVKGKVKELKLGADYQPLPISGDGTAAGDAVFVGYGIAQQGVYDSFGTIDLKGKIAVLLEGLPPSLTDEQRNQLLPSASTPHKAVRIRERGAAALVVVRTLEPGTKPSSIRPEFGNADVGLPAVSVQSNWLIEALKASGHSPAAIRDSLNRGQSIQPIALNRKLQLMVKLERVPQSCHNVVAYLVPASQKLEETEFVVIGAHYDHLGRGHLKEASRSPKELQDEIHNGADDNASGTAAVLELAAYFAERYQTQPNRYKRGLIVAAWSGEEMGLIGSQRFMADLPVRREQIRAYINFDMVGSLRDNRLFAQATGSALEWKGILEKKNVAAGFDLKLHEDPWLPTDVTSFYAQRIPVLNFFTGLTSTYHTTEDDPSTLNYEGLERICRFAALVIEELLQGSSLTYQESANPGAGRRRMNSTVYLGTIPDYAGEGEGLLLSGVRSGAPADRAGIQAGDRIVELNGKPVRSIYDYTSALDSLEIGKPVQVIVLRQGQRLILSITPSSRD